MTVEVVHLDLGKYSKELWGGFIMAGASDNNNGCEVCARASADCKTKVAQLEKRNFRLAIALTAALTLLGQQGVKTVVGMVEAMRQVAGQAPKDAKETASADGDVYHFGGSPTSPPVFSGWRPSWWEPVETTSGTPLTFAGAGWDRPRAAGLISDMLTATPLSYIPQAAWHLPVQTNFGMPLLPTPPTAELLASLPIDPPDFTTPSPFGGYIAHLEVESKSATTIPGPGPLCVFAVGGLFGSRSRY